MVNVDFLNISNAKLIGRLLPFWARGRKTSLLLQALLSPIISIHSNFKSWALEKFIECHITAQRSSLEWFLKYKLKKHFISEEDVFYIADGIDRTKSCFNGNYWVNELPWDNQMYWAVDKNSENNTDASHVSSNSGKLKDKQLWQILLPWIKEPNEVNLEDYYIQLIKNIIVYAPAIINTINYNTEDYERDIRYIMSKYMINFKKINIIIADTNPKS